MTICFRKCTSEHSGSRNENLCYDAMRLMRQVSLFARWIDVASWDCAVAYHDDCMCRVGQGLWKRGRYSIY